MNYVYVPPATSQKAHRLAGELGRVIEDFRRENRGVTDAEVRAALRLAGTRASGSARKEALIAAGVALLFGLGLLAFFFVQRG
jgi:hypothetical protein